ncbi:Membrane protein YdfJ [compost metagenome]
MFAALADALAPWIHRRRWWVVAAWIAVVVWGVVAMGGLNKLLGEDTGAANATSTRANAILRDRFGFNALTELGVIIESGTAPAPAVAAHRDRLVAALKAVPGVEAVRQIPVPPEVHGLALEHVTLDSTLKDAQAIKVAQAVQACLAANPPPPGARANVMGRPIVMGDLTAINDREVVRIERISLVITLVVLVLVFGSLVAAALPVAMGLVGIVATLGLLASLGGAVPVVSLTRLITGVIAIALGIDYALFVVSRYREEREAGREPVPAVREAIAQAGEAVAFSGLIMIASVGALAIPDLSASRAIAGAVAIVVAIAVASSLTLLPALLLILDRYLPTPSWLARFRWGHGEAAWSAFARRVLKHHRLVLALSVAAVALLVVPIGQMRVWEPGPTLMPKELPARQAYDALAEAGLAGELNAFFVTIHQPPGPATLAPGTMAFMDATAKKLQADPRIRRVDSLVTVRPDWTLPRYQTLYAQLDNPIARLALMPRLKGALHQDETGTYVIMRVIPAVGLTSPALRDLAVELGREVLPALPRPAGVTMDLGGDVARRVDLTGEMYAHMPAIIAAVLGSVYLLLLVYFRSLLLPLKAVLMNALPVLGATGVLVLVMQHGVGLELLGMAETPGAILAMTPVMVFCLTFGLSMDYEVLILSRIQEAHRRGLDDEAAIIEGMTRTSGIITGAALIMLSVFAPNMASALANAKELGLALSAAIVIDATVVRLLLVPTAMRAMGRWNWYFPGRGH